MVKRRNRRRSKNKDKERYIMYMMDGSRHG